ncbi:MAG: hypothetical protein JNL69_08655, partial [Bacteroidia bacterium]|nr:hypothetical protein [Bacteroidia bacterium]
MNKKTVWLFTGGFPYSYGETHIESEILTLSKEFEKIYLIPPVNFKKQTTRVLPSNTEVIILADQFNENKKSLFFSNFFFILKTLIVEFVKTQNKKSFLCYFREFSNLFLQRIAEAEQLQHLITSKGDTNYAVFYSYWFSDWATVMGIVKHRGVIPSFVSRAHRFDVYEHLTSKKIIPFRQFQLKMIDKVLTDSQKAADFMIKNTSYPSKISCSYYGSVDYGLNPFNENDVFRIVSCSILIPRKRVHLIIETLKQINFPVEWIHFGDGELMEDLKKLAMELPNNITVDFKGQVSNTDVLNYYK